jgi:hypothetical protein
MSFYNMLFGVYPMYFALLSTAQPISIDDVPRFHDVQPKRTMMECLK